MTNPLDPAVLARIDRLELEARQFVEGYLAGKHRSPRHGFAVEFAQHREYAPGDDVKHIDWAVYARTKRYFLKQYEQETNLVAWLIIDASESMGYGSKERTKYDLWYIENWSVWLDVKIILLTVWHTIIHDDDNAY